MKLENVTLEELPPPIDKSLKFTIEKLNFNFTITDNILTQLPDGSFSFNVYHEDCKIICKVTRDAKVIRFESSLYSKQNVLLEWESWVKKVTELACSSFDDLFEQQKTHIV